MILPKALIEHDCGELGGETGCEYVKQTITIWQIQKAPVAKKGWYGFIHNRERNVVIVVHICIVSMSHYMRGFPGFQPFSA